MINTNENVKVILGKTKQQLKMFQSSDKRTIDAYYIVTSDGTQFILGLYEIVEDETKLEIDGKYYKPLSSFDPKYPSTWVSVIDIYIKQLQLNPPKLMTELQSVLDYTKELQVERKRLYGL
jgi:hypothetical protein